MIAFRIDMDRGAIAFGGNVGGDRYPHKISWLGIQIVAGGDRTTPGPLQAPAHDQTHSPIVQTNLASNERAIKPF